MKADYDEVWHAQTLMNGSIVKLLPDAIIQFSGI